MIFGPFLFMDRIAHRYYRRRAITTLVSKLTPCSEVEGLHKDVDGISIIRTVVEQRRPTRAQRSQLAGRYPLQKHRPDQ